MEKENYYSSKGNKKLDFGIGIAVGVTIPFVMGPIGGIAYSFLDHIAPSVSIYLAIILGAISPLTAIGIAVFAKRRYIGIGMLVGLIIPIVVMLLLFGACIVVLSGGSVFR